MSLSDCVNCWDTPCTCGYKYLHWDYQRLRDFHNVIHDVIVLKETRPDLFEGMPYEWTGKEEAWEELKKLRKE